MVYCFARSKRLESYLVISTGLSSSNQRPLFVPAIQLEDSFNEFSLYFRDRVRLCSLKISHRLLFDTVALCVCMCVFVFLSNILMLFFILSYRIRCLFEIFKRTSKFIIERHAKISTDVFFIEFFLGFFFLNILS